ncbi:MAG: transcription elongation factor Spt5 [Thaumarchaeota archaeon]|nr:transcription elongation factor Spt5 [Nitrososphaerota archaeon]
MSELVVPSRIYAVKTTGGQEKSVASFVGSRAQLKGKSIYAILVLEHQKGYVFFEAPNAQAVDDAIVGFKHIKSKIPGNIMFEDIQKFLAPKVSAQEFGRDDIVEVVAGPFKGMRAKISRVEKNDATFILLDAPYQMPVTTDINSLRLIEKAKAKA